MGNVHALAHRFTAISMACLSSAALILGVMAGTSCSFLTLTPENDQFLMTLDGVEVQNGNGESVSANIGVNRNDHCDSGALFYDSDDRMWQLSQIFFLVGCLVLGSLTTALAWAQSTFPCWAPTPARWRLLSILAAFTAVLEVPIFIALEAEPCTMDLSRQTCHLGVGSYFLIGSILLWVAVTLSTQCLDPPSWKDELQAWVLSGGSDGDKSREGIEITVPSQDEAGFTSDGEHESGASRNPSPMGGGLFVTNNDDGGDLAIWTNEKTTSDAEGQEWNAQEYANANDNAAAHGDDRDGIKNADIRKGAAIVMDSVLRNQLDEIQDNRRQVIGSRLVGQAVPSNRKNSRSSKSKKSATAATAGKPQQTAQSLRTSNALMDSASCSTYNHDYDYDYHVTQNQTLQQSYVEEFPQSTARTTAPQQQQPPSMKVTIVCPDGSQEKATLGQQQQQQQQQEQRSKTRFVSEQKDTGLQLKAAAVAAENNNMKRQTSNPSTTFDSLPSTDDEIQVNNRKTNVKTSEASTGTAKDPLSILRDLARCEDYGQQQLPPPSVVEKNHRSSSRRHQGLG
jgi:hypothetical protein